MNAKKQKKRKVKKENMDTSKESDSSLRQQYENNASSKPKKVNMLEKWQLNAPYYIFYNTIPEIPDTLAQKNAITFADLLCPSLGKLKDTLQFSFRIDFDWLMEQYKTQHVDTLPMTMISSQSELTFQEYKEEYNCPPDIIYHQVTMENDYGIHHSKIGIFVYDDDSLRVIVSTANLYQSDWEIRNQGLWLSPPCPLMTDETTNNGDSSTGFKYDLLNYLKVYKAPCLEPWIKRVEKADFGDIRVFLVVSIPGIQYPEEQNCHIFSVEKILKKHCHLPKETVSNGQWRVIGQSSSIGSVGYREDGWFLPVLKALSAHRGITPGIFPYAIYNFIFPTMENVENGLTDEVTMVYEEKIYQRQKWFRQYLHQWKSDRLSRSTVMPHIKSYARVSPCFTKLAYYLLTSANFSRGGWGTEIHPNESAKIKSYEAGVLFLPELFNEDYFEITETEKNKNFNLFPVMYDIPLTPYTPVDSPYTTE